MAKKIQSLLGQRLQMVVYYCMSHGSTGVDIIKEDNRAPVSSKELSSFERDKIIEKKKKL